MQTKFDDLDNIIADSFDEIHIKSNYNEIILNKLHSKKSFKNQTRIAAFSFITAGFLIMFMCTPSVQYKLIELRFKFKSHTIALQYQYSDKLNLIKNIIGE